MDVLSVFGEDEEPEAETPEAPEPVEQPDPQPQVETPAEPEPEPAPEPDTPTEDARHVPLPTYLEMRDRAKDAERRAADLEARQAPQPVAEEMPDPIDDPKGFAAWQDARVEQAVTANRFQMSDVMARQAYGAEVVEAAAVWAAEKAKADPTFSMSYMREAHPIDWIVREHKRQGLLSEIGDSPDDWFTREAEKRGYIQAAPNGAAPAVPAAQPAMRPAVPPRSIASDAPASRTAGETDGRADFMAIFDKG